MVVTSWGEELEQRVFWGGTDLHL